MIHKTDLLSMLSLIAGLTSALLSSTFSSVLDKRYGDHVATVTMLVVGCAFIVCSQAIRYINAPGGQANATSAVIETLQQVASVLSASHSSLAAVLAANTQVQAADAPPPAQTISSGLVAPSPSPAPASSSPLIVPNTETAGTIPSTAAPPAQGV